MIFINHSLFFNKIFLQTLPLLFALSCSYPPIEKKKLYYSKDKIEVFYQSSDILKKLGYEIDIFSPESFALSTKKTQIKKSLRRYDYIIFIKVNDYIELHLAVERNIFNRGSESNIGDSGMIIKQVESYMPKTSQNKIFKPLEIEFKKNGYKLVVSKHFHKY